MRICGVRPSNTWASVFRLNRIDSPENALRTYFIYVVNKVLRILSREVSDRIDLIRVREYHRDQRNAFMYGKCIADQGLPR